MHTSQRFLINSEDDDDEIPELVQQKIAKKLKKIIQNQIEFIEETNLTNGTSNKKSKSGLRLFKESGLFLKSPLEEIPEIILNNRPVIKRRKIKEDSSEDETSKLKSAAVDSVYILSTPETKLWHTGRKKNIFEYKKGKDSKLHEKEVINEFTKLRRKNDWSERKISRKNKKQKK